MKMMNRHLETMSKGERSKNSKKLKSILDAFKEDPSFDQERMVIKGISKVQYLYLGTGMLYLVSISVRNLGSKSVRIIEKMVWEGSSMEVLGIQTEEKLEGDSICTESVYDKDFEDFVNLVMFEATTLSFDFARFHVVKENVERRMYNPTSGFDFKYYFLIFEGDLHDDFKEKAVRVVIQASVLCRNWLQILDDKKTADIRAWLTQDHIPPIKDPLPMFHIHPFDLTSPQVLSQAWLVLEDHYCKYGKRLEFVKVINAKSSPTTGRNYYLTVQAKDHGSIGTYHIATREVIPQKCWKPVTPLVSGKEDDGVDELFNERFPSKRIKVNI